MQRGQLAGMVAGGPALEHEAVAQPTGEPHPDPGPGHRVGVLVGGDRVVERPVEVGQRHVDHHAGDGQLRLRHTR